MPTRTPDARPALHPGRRRDRDDRARRISLARRRRRLAGQPRGRAQPARRRERPVRRSTRPAISSPVPFPNSAATVEERRAEAMLTYGRPLTPNLTLQASLGGEYSQLTPGAAPAASPAPSTGPRASSTSPGGRARASTSAPGSSASSASSTSSTSSPRPMSARGTTNAGNANLVPPQSWNAQLQATRNLGRWGTARRGSTAG